jgi:hypothetical protein
MRTLHPLTAIIDVDSDSIPENLSSFQIGESVLVQTPDSVLLGIILKLSYDGGLSISYDVEILGTIYSLNISTFDTSSVHAIPVDFLTKIDPNDMQNVSDLVETFKLLND